MATKKPITKKVSKPKQNVMADQQQAEQQEFLMWLLQKLGVQDEMLLEQKIQELGEEGLKLAYVQFQQEKQNMLTQAFRAGGMFNHLVNLLSFKKGNKIEKECKDCEESKKKLQMVNVTKQTAGLEKGPKSLIKKKK